MLPEFLSEEKPDYKKKLKMLSWQHCSRRGEDKLLKWKGDSVRKRERTTLTFMYVYRRPSVRPSVCQSLSHFVSFSSQATQPLQLAPTIVAFCGFHTFLAAHAKHAKNSPLSGVISICLPCAAILYFGRSPMRSRKPQLESTARNPLPVH